VKDQQNIPTITVSASAFCKARKKFRESAFVELNHKVNDDFYDNSAIQTWNNFRVLAVDGSKYTLPVSKLIMKYFGGQPNQHKTVPMALGSCLYDVFQGTCIDAQLAPYHSSERDLAYCHLDYTQDGDLIVYDRGYPAFWLFAAHQAMNRDYCMRVKASFNQETKDFVASGKKQAFVTLKASTKIKKACDKKGLSHDPIKVRLLRIKTSKGVYILITSLLSKRNYPIKAFKELYHLRWQVEEGYKKQKCWIEIENFKGQSVLAVKQEFHAKVLSQTLTAITIYAAQSYIKTSVSHRKLAYKINFAQTLSSMKDTLVKMILGHLTDLEVMRWLKSISQCLSAVRPGRSFERKKASVVNRKYNISYTRAF